MEEELRTTDKAESCKRGFMLKSCWRSLTWTVRGQWTLISLQAFGKWSSHPKTNGFSRRRRVQVPDLFFRGSCKGK